MGILLRMMIAVLDVSQLSWWWVLLVPAVMTVAVARPCARAVGMFRVAVAEWERESLVHWWIVSFIVTFAYFAVIPLGYVACSLLPPLVLHH